ncbi:unnamed protein product [Lactuca virosa]|uniref:Uncharacterized protein n=1 Tax=Lactuca virosa TaxID=75947 RepID=A0AAU9LXQ4_9ASTR|nr:unnamed protein product [Lactuca virosa]
MVELPMFNYGEVMSTLSLLSPPLPILTPTLLQSLSLSLSLSHTTPSNLSTAVLCRRNAIHLRAGLPFSKQTVARIVSKKLQDS